MSDRNTSDDSERQNRTQFAAPAASSEATVKQTRGSPFAADCDHVNFHSVTLHDNLATIVVSYAANVRKWRQNLHYKVSSQQTLKTNNEYVPKSSQIKLDIAGEKGTKECDYFQYLIETHQ